MDSTNPSHLPAFAAMQATADRLAVTLQRVEVRAAADLEAVFPRFQPAMKPPPWPSP
jgi:hypothetical protein